jgi:hypothetical protein
MLHARIAGMTVSFQSNDSDFFEKRLAEYKIPTPEKSDLNLRVIASDKVEAPEGKEVLRHGAVSLTEMTDGRLALCTFAKSDGKVLQSTVFQPDYSAVEITLYRDRNRAGMTNTDWEYVYTGVAFSNRLAYLGGLVLHGSSIAYEGKGVVFSAPSGTGKSTHTALWEQCFGEKVVPINDDKPAIRFKEEQPFLYGTPWSGKTDRNHNLSVPLKAIVFIERAKENRIRRLSPTEAMMYIGSQTVRPFYDAGQGLRVLDCTEKLIKTIPMYLLGCTISEEAVGVVKQELQW